MTINVYTWPPVPVTGAEWTEDAPVQVSRSITTGKDYTSAAQRKRRMATLQVAALGHPNNMGAGYVEVLKRFLANIHAVRLYSFPINWHLDAIRDRAALESMPLGWTSGGSELTWTMPPETLVWYSNVPLTGVVGTSGGWDIVTVSGLPASRLVARPGDFVKVQEDPADTGAVAQVIAPSRSDASGVAIVRLFSALPYDGIITMNASDTGVFKPMGLPRSTQPVGANWYYDWSFREVFEDEVDGFVEVDPWS